ncbi:MAG: AIR synthase-related protein, partial [Candidatus Hodarchaeota archaeon]
TSFAVALSYSDPTTGEKLLEGLIQGSNTFCVPIVRGHTNPASESTYVVGSATGTVVKNNLLTAGGAKSGDHLVLLYDPQGQRGASYKLGWDSVTGRDADAVVKRLSIMNELAETHLITAAKDVSVAGVVGTAGMLLEYSERGGAIDLRALDGIRPSSIELEDWIRMFISLGFLVSVPQKNFKKVTEIAKKHEVKATIIGEVDDSASLRLLLDGEESIMFDFSEGPVLTPRGSSGVQKPS